MGNHHLVLSKKYIKLHSNGNYSSDGSNNKKFRIPSFIDKSSLINNENSQCKFDEEAKEQITFGGNKYKLIKKDE